MKKSNLYIIALTVAVGAFGITFLTPKLTAADGAMGSCGSGMSTSSCCGGMSMSMSDTTAKPDLMTTCPVSGNKLGAMGQPFVFTYKGQEVKLCCGACKKDFDKDADKYTAEIRAADKK
jgi:YHS domain-containing protein